MALSPEKLQGIFRVVYGPVARGAWRRDDVRESVDGTERTEWADA